MIKLLLLDLDNCLLGTRKGYNYPVPDVKVIRALKGVQESGIPVCLFSNRAAFVVKLIAEKAALHSLQLAEHGAVLFAPNNNTIFKVATLPQQELLELIVKTRSRNTYWELYSLSDWYIRSDAEQSYALERQETVNVLPWNEVEDLVPLVLEHKFVRASILCYPETETYYRELIQDYNDKLGSHCYDTMLSYPARILELTAKGINRQENFKKLLDHYQVEPQEVLALTGDIKDWKILQHMGYLATLANAAQELQDKILTKGGYVGPGVDSDGIIRVIEYFRPEMSAGGKQITTLYDRSEII